MVKYPKYAEYKDSGVEALGLIPKGWSILRGKFLFKEINERSESGEETLLSVSEYYGVKPREEKIADGDFLTRAESLEGYKKCYPNDLVMNIMLAWKRGLGVSKYEGIVSPAYSVFRFSEQVNSDYIHYLLRTEEYTKYFKTRSTGIIDSRLRLYPESFGDIFILFPTLEIQTQIANFLDHETAKIDTLIAKQEKLIELLKEKRQAVISHAVTKGLNPNVQMKDSGVEWLGEVPEHWKVSKLKHFVNVIDCKHITAEFFDEGIPLASIGEVKGWKVNLAKAKLTNEKYYQELIDGNRKPQIGDIIYTRNATVGEAAIVHEELPKFALGQDVCLIHIVQKLSPEFLLHFLKSEIIKIQLNSAMVGSTFKRINVDDIRNYVVVIPPIEDQQLILNDLNKKIDKYDSLISLADSQIKFMQERRTALISAAVTGKIDVRNWQHSNKNNNQDNMELSA